MAYRRVIGSNIIRSSRLGAENVHSEAIIYTNEDNNCSMNTNLGEIRKNIHDLEINIVKEISKLKNREEDLAGNSGPQ
jgi:hypothetical protein